MSPERGLHYEVVRLRGTVDALEREIRTLAETLRSMNVRVPRDPRKVDNRPSST